MNRSGWLVNLLFIAGIFVVFFVSATYRERDEDVLWSRFVGKTGRDIAYDLALLDDGIVIVGWTSSQRIPYDQNVMMVKLSKNGKLLWNKELGSTGTEGANCVERTHDDGFIVAAISSSDDDEIPAQFGGQDVWLLKYDAQGNLLWKRCYGSEAYESVLDLVEDEGYLFVGYTTRMGNEDVWMVKVDENGKIVWEGSLGSDGWDSAIAVDKATDGYYVVGLTRPAEINSVNGFADMWVLKVSKSGEPVWQKRIGGNDWDQASDVLTTADGGCLVLGTSWSEEMSFFGRADFVLVKLDASGEIEFQRAYGGEQDDIAQKIIRIQDGYLLVGTTWSDTVNGVKRQGGSDYLVLKIDENGEVVWVKCLGALLDDVAYAVFSDGESYYLAGVSYSRSFALRSRSHGEGDALVLRVKLK
ncbi:MAG: hypothetical protein H5T93_02000 [Pseudothermotoga sp.]|uniref:hypothetical protein n=1 Tax=Pseudothermotoga sp. TaxID=2033661 RepID=UPI000B0E163C|nr:hypothetical protein [Pseudothermotoga sp.]HBT38941.1 hypothetical protein [Pseudothermotoga sp.]HCO97776.1 hypothetical protein [Pseudothermotoga sp.]